MKLNALILLLLTSIVSCDNTEKYDKLIGKWTCSEWIVPSTGTNNCSNNTVSFNFKGNKTYTYRFGSLNETGVYKISGNTLYSKPDGKLEIGVEINKLTHDSLEFIMSRSGDKEILRLIKESN